MKHNINRWLFEIPASDVRDDKDDLENGKNPCFCCGKEIKEKNGKPSFVHLLTNGNLVSTDQEFDNDQGFFPIGNECKKRLPNNFIFTRH